MKNTPDGPPPEIQESDDIRTHLIQESGLISWSELVRHFARGVVLKIDVSLDLIDAAVCLSTDDKHTLQQWLDDNSVSRASDDDARDWTEREPDFLCIVAAPWVLVQERPAPSELH